MGEERVVTVGSYQIWRIESSRRKHRNRSRILRNAVLIRETEKPRKEENGAANGKERHVAYLAYVNGQTQSDACTRSVEKKNVGK